MPQVIVPRVHPALCSKHVMVMEEIYPSTPLHHALDEQAAILARQRGVSKAEFLRIEKARIDCEAKEAAKRGRLVRQLSANTYDKYIAVQKTKRRLVTAWRSVWNATVGLLARSLRYDVGSALAADVLVPINAAYPHSGAPTHDSQPTHLICPVRGHPFMAMRAQLVRCSTPAPRGGPRPWPCLM